MRNHFRIFMTAACVSFILSGCSSKKEVPYEERSATDLYQGALQQLDSGEYKKSAELFEEVTRQHPYSKWSEKAQIMEAYAQYRGQKYDNVIASLEAFVGLHPAHDDIPYALYMIGLSYYEQIGASKRDQQDTLDAIRTFKDLIARFPGTPYAKDAQAKIVFLMDIVAEKSMDVGRFYQDKHSYQSAITRFQEVVDRFQTTRHVEEALHRIVECYVAMGMRDAAVNTASVLGHNYPGSVWYQSSYDLLQGDRESKLNKHKPTATTAEMQKMMAEEGFFSRIKNWYKGKRGAVPKPSSIKTEKLSTPKTKR